MRLLEPLPIEYSSRLNDILHVGVAVLFCSAIYTSYHWGYLEASKAADELYSKVRASGIYFPDVLNMIRAVISICAAIGVLGVYVRRVIGLSLAGLGYVIIVLSYLWWYNESMEILRGAEISWFTTEMSHIGPFIDAGWIDIIILVIVLIIIVVIMNMFYEMIFRGTGLNKKTRG